MSLEQAKEMVGRALGVPGASAAYVLDHLDQLGLRLTRYLRSQGGSRALAVVKRVDGREFSKESGSDEEAIYLAVGDALLAPPVEEVLRTESVLAGSENVTLVVSKVSGLCPAKYAVGSRWVLAGPGATRPRLCKPAIAALEKLIGGLPMKWSQGVFTCACPARLGGVEFTVQRLPAASRPEGQEKPLGAPVRQPWVSGERPSHPGQERDCRPRP